MFKIKIALAVIIVAAVGGFVFRAEQSTNKQEAADTKSSTAAAAATLKQANHCAGNTLTQQVFVSITQQHLWACYGTSLSFDTPVITGMEMYPADLTPLGAYKIYGRQTDQRLTGHDSTGSWDDPVSYWMPFLSNRYGVYGFHDATWRADADFGKIDINAPFTSTAKSASHGCVELPLTAMKWLYDWAPVGTTVTVQS